MRGYVTATRAGTPLAVNLRDVLLPAGDVLLEGDLAVPEQAEGFVVLSFATPQARRQQNSLKLATSLHAVGLGTLHLDLLTPEELNRAAGGPTLVPLQVLSSRLGGAASWLVEQAGPGDFPLGLVGFQRSGAASLLAATALQQRVRAVVAEDSGPQAAARSLRRLHAPVLFVESTSSTDPGSQDAAVELAREWLHYHLLQRPLQFLTAASLPVLMPALN